MIFSPTRLSRALARGRAPLALVAFLIAGALPAAARPATAAEPGAEAFARADSVADVARSARGLRLGDRLHLEGIELDGETVGLDLERFRVFAEDGELVVHGKGGDEVRRFEERAYFRGPVIGEPGSLAVITVLDDGTVRGVVRRETGLWSLAPGPERPTGGRPLAAKRPAQSEAEPFACGNTELAELGDPAALSQEAAEFLQSIEESSSAVETGPESVSAASTTPYTVEVAIETDYELFLGLGSVQAITDYAGDLIAFASSMYDAEIGTNLVISHLSAWNHAGDPWTQTNPSCAMYEFGRYWNDNRGAVERTIAHFLSGKTANSGVAWVGVLCRDPFNVNLGSSCPGLSPSIDNYGGAYGFTGGIDGNFDPDNPNKVWDIIAVAHEIGHNFNSPHTHCYNGLGGSSDPVDRCYNGQAGQGCYSGGQSLPGPAGQASGTIMSYCHLLSPGMSNIAFSLGTGHPYGTLPQRVPDRMRAHVESRAASVPGCFVRQDPGGGGGGGDPTDPPCPEELLLRDGSVSSILTEETCGVIYAGGSYGVGSTGDLTLRAFQVVLEDGFSVASGGSLTVDTQ